MKATNLSACGRLLICLIALAPAAAFADPGPASQPSTDWPRWRGPNGDNVPAIKAFPMDLAKGLAKLWSVDNLCKGPKDPAWSCPSIVGDKLVVTGREGDKDLVVCLSGATGQQLWRQEYDAPTKQDVQYGNGPRATPIIDGERVYTFGCQGHLACWSLADGKQQWLLGEDKLGGQRPMWGHSSTPLVIGDRIYVMVGGKNLVLALDKKTGERKWASLPGQAGYAALTTVKYGDADHLIAFSAASLIGLSLDKGEKLWEFKWPTAFGMNCTTPVVVGNKLLIGTSEYRNKDGSSGGLALIELLKTGPKAVWENHDVGFTNNDPAIVNGLAFGYVGYSMNPKGFACIDLANGKVKWETDKLGGPGTVIRVGNDLLCLSNRGMLTLVRAATDGLDQASEFQAVKGYPVWTEPVIAGSRLYVRFANQLVCYKIGE